MSSTPSPNIERIESDVQTLSKVYGPRPYGSMPAGLAALYVQEQLEAAGWEPKEVQPVKTLWPARAKAKPYFTAHTDSVSQSPGVIDNAVGVGILLRLPGKRRLAISVWDFRPQKKSVCRLSVSGEQMQQWHPESYDLELVIALDLTGYGRLSITGIGPLWSATMVRMAVCTDSTTLTICLRVVSNHSPAMERSDHYPFAAKGMLSAHLLGRGPSGCS